MSIGDPIADMLTRIRNAVHIKAKGVTCLNSKVCRGIANVRSRANIINATIGWKGNPDGGNVFSLEIAANAQV